MPEFEYVLPAYVNLIIADTPTVNNRTYSLECLNVIREQIQEQINNRTALVYDSFIPDAMPPETPDFSKVVGIIEGVKLTDRLHLDIRFIKSYFDESVLSSTEVMPVILGEVIREGEIKAVKNPKFMYFTLSPKLVR